MDNLFETIRRAVHINWDPIGVFEPRTEMGEYDSYIKGLYELIRKKASEKEIFEYLWTVETNSIGLQGDRSATERFAKWLWDLSKLTEL